MMMTTRWCVRLIRSQGFPDDPMFRIDVEDQAYLNAHQIFFMVATHSGPPLVDYVCVSPSCACARACDDLVAANPDT